MLTISQIGLSSGLPLVVGHLGGPAIHEIPLGNSNKGLGCEKRNLKKEEPGEK